MFEVIPRLPQGVYIHFHDIFLPAEYPKDWVLEENRSWNEQYLVRALVMLNHSFQVIFGCKYAELRFPGEISQALQLPDGRSYGGGSFWIQKMV